MRALSSARCTGVRLYTLRIKIGTNERALGELSHYWTRVRGKFNNASALGRSLYWCQALHIMNKDRYQSTSARRALALLNTPQVYLTVGVLLSCQPRVTVTSCFVYKIIRDFLSIDLLCINHICRKILRNCHSWLARQYYCITICMLGNFLYPCLSSVDFFRPKSSFFEKLFQTYHQSVKYLGSRSDRQNVGPDMGPNCLQRLLADDTSQETVKVCFKWEFTVLPAKKWQWCHDLFTKLSGTYTR